MQDKKARKHLIQGIKKERGCLDCGYKLHAVALDFDHRPGTVKMFGLANPPTGTTWEQILREIDKCDVRCANCHRVKTQWRRLNRLNSMNTHWSGKKGIL